MKRRSFFAALTTIVAAPLAFFRRPRQTVYFTPYKGSRISLYDGEQWHERTAQTIVSTAHADDILFVSGGTGYLFRGNEIHVEGSEIHMDATPASPASDRP